MISRTIILDEYPLLEIVGVRIDNDVTYPQFYLLYITSSELRPLDHDGYPILFFPLAKHREALEISTCGCNHLPIDSLDDIFCIDIAEMIYELGEFNETKYANILDSLNMILDFVNFLHEDRINTRYKKIMRTAADHFTFSKNIEELFEAADFTRIELIQAIEWALGATMLWAKYVY